MKALKVTDRMKHKVALGLLKSKTEELTDFRAKTKELIYTLVYPKRRNLMTIATLTGDGKINGITIPELVMLIKLKKGTNEHIVLEVQNDNSVLFVAEANDPYVSVSSL